MSISLKKLASQFAVISLGRVIGAAAIFATTVIIAQVFGTTTMAHYSLFLSIASIASALLPFGFQSTASLFSAEYRAKHQHDAVSAVSSYGQRLIALGALITVPFVLGVVVFAPEQSDYNISLLAILAVPMSVGMAYLFLNGGVLIGLDRPYYAHLPDMTLRPLLLLAAVGVLALIRPDGSPAELLILVCCVLWIVMVSQWVVLKRITAENLTHEEQTYSTEAEKKKWWKIAPSYMSITLLWDYFFEIHMLIAAFLVSPADVALLFVCFRIRQLAGFGMRSIYALLFPKAFAANALDEKEGTQKTITLAARVSCLYAVLVWLGVALIAPYILLLFGEEFEGGQLILLLLMGTMLARAVFGPSPAVLGMKRHPGLVVRVLVVSLVVSVSVMVLGLQFGGGVTIIASAYLISTVFTAATLWVIAKRKTGIDSAIWARTAMA